MQIRQDARWMQDVAGTDIKKSGFVVLDFTKQEVVNAEYRSIVYQHRDILGRGSYGVVYRAYSLNVETGTVDFRHPLALKKFFKPSSDNAREAAIFNAQYGKCELLSDGVATYMAMTCLPGKPLIKYDKIKKCFQLDNDLLVLSFHRRVELICGIMLAVMLIHHETPSTGAAVIHGDINGSNILFSVDPDTKAFDVCLIDFGLSEFVKSSNDVLQDADMVGSFLFMANEIVEQELHGVKTDIYALTPILALVLGAHNPFSARQSRQWFVKDYFKIPYDLSGLLTTFPVPVFSFDISYVIKLFLERMQHVSPNMRPDSVTALKFFVTLNNLCIAHADIATRGEVSVLLAKLVLLAKGHDVGMFEGLDTVQQMREAKNITRPLLYKTLDLRRGSVFSHYKSVLSARHGDMKNISTENDHHSAEGQCSLTSRH